MTCDIRVLLIIVMASHLGMPLQEDFIQRDIVRGLPGAYGYGMDKYIGDTVVKYTSGDMFLAKDEQGKTKAEPARVKVVVASVMQPTFEYRDPPNASL